VHERGAEHRGRPVFAHRVGEIDEIVGDFVKDVFLYLAYLNVLWRGASNALPGVFYRRLARVDHRSSASFP
jgi:hypothetical protein